MQGDEKKQIQIYGIHGKTEKNLKRQKNQENF